MSWQAELVWQALAAARDEPAVVEAAVTGSMAGPDHRPVDAWSDVDLRLLVISGRSFDGRRFVEGFGTPWALTVQAAPEGVVHRVVYDDGRRLDVVVAGGEVGAGASVVPGADAELMAFRQAAALAVVKLARDDLLIGVHLALDLVQRCLVQAMLLRDRRLGTTRHRAGGPLNEVVDRLDRLRRHPWTADGAMALVREAAVVHDELAAQLDPAHVPDWSGLDALLRQAGR